MCELIYYHAVIIFCICLVQNCLSQVKISETVCESVLVLKLSVLKRTSKRLFIHPWLSVFNADGHDEEVSGEVGSGLKGGRGGQEAAEAGEQRLQPLSQ